MPRRRPGQPLVSPTGEVLSRATTFKYALDLTRAQERDCFSFAGARRYTFNHHVGRVKVNLSQRQAERSYGITDEALTPPLSWSDMSFINHMNAHKNGTDPQSPTSVSEDTGDTVRGLPWSDQVSTDVFETASVDAAVALKNFTDSKNGVRDGKQVGFPKFKSKHKTTPAFRLRNRKPPGGTGNVRVDGNKALVLPKLGRVRIHGACRKMRRMIASGRFHIYTATVKYEKGRWWVAVTGMAAVFHHQRRSPKNRHTRPAGMDRGVTTLTVTADDQGQVLHLGEGVKALQKSETKLKRAHQALARTKPGSGGRAKVKRRLVKLHAQVVFRRAHAAHQITTHLAAVLTGLVTEDLNIAGMMASPPAKPDPDCPGHYLRNGAAAKSGLAKAVGDASMGQVGRMLEYKADWYGMTHVVADRWFPSSKMCSACKHVKGALSLDERTFTCDKCGFAADRDVNAAINLADWVRYEPVWRAGKTATRRKKPHRGQVPAQAV